MRGRMTTPRETKQVRKDFGPALGPYKVRYRRKAYREDRQAIRQGDYEKVTMGLDAWNVS